jgi:hypothetical protein
MIGVTTWNREPTTEQLLLQNKPKFLRIPLFWFPNITSPIDVIDQYVRDLQTVKSRGKLTHWSFKESPHRKRKYKNKISIWTFYITWINHLQTLNLPWEYTLFPDYFVLNTIKLSSLTYDMNASWILSM